MQFDRNSIRAAVTLALDTAMPAMIEELTERVVLALSHRRSPLSVAFLQPSS